MQTAKTILEQLGGNKFIAMVGARGLVALKDGVSLKFMPNKSKANTLRITVGGLDLYKMEFLSVRGFKVTTKAEFNNVYADQLQTIFRSTTGLETKLF